MADPAEPRSQPDEPSALVEVTESPADPGPREAAEGAGKPESDAWSDIELVTDTSQKSEDEEDEWGGLGEVWAELPERDPGPSIALPELEIVWPAGLAPSLADALGRGDGPARDQLVAELPALWELVTQTARRVGLGCLTDGSVRWGGGRWQLAPFPRCWPGDPVLAGSWNAADPQSREAAWLQDRQALAGALVDAVTTRRPVDVADALALIDEAAGEVAEGMDAVLHLLLGPDLPPGDVAPLHALHEVLARKSGGPVGYRCFRETLVGSAKAAGRIEDNEDLAWWRADQRGSVALVLLDGITGDHDGSGHAAASAALRAARALWSQDETEPLTVLRGAEAQVMECPRDAGAAAVFARLGRDGRCQLASVGDSAAWLLRPHATDRSAPFAAWRLTPVHTERAERRRHDDKPLGGRAALTRHLGGAALHPFTLAFRMTPGDLLVLVSDGAAEPGPDGGWFGAVLNRLATDRAAAGRRVAPGLAADLVVRGESLGGHDNATVLIAECTADQGETAE
jgi:serine/threonine protein phosphatase PrpC